MLSAAFFLTMFFLTSCGGIRSEELSERLIIEAIGIDTENGSYTVTLQALDTGAAGSGEGASANETTKIYNFTGSSIGMAFSLARNADGLTPLYSHARILILGKEAAKHEPGKLLDFFLREYTARSDILLAAAEGKAADIITADIADGTADAAVLERLLENGGKSGKNVLMPLYKFVNLLQSETDIAYCPVLSALPSSAGGKQDVAVTGTALFGKEGCIRTADEAETEGILLLNGKTGAMSFSVEGKSGRYTLNTVKSRTKIRPGVSGGKARFLIKTQLVCDMTEYASALSDSVGIREAEEAEKALIGQIKQKEKKVLEDILLQNGMDVCRFGRRILLRHPGFYEKYVSDISALTEYELTVEVTVRRTGREIWR